MKKFKYPLRITGNKEEISSIIKDLENLGYRFYGSELEGHRTYNLVTDDLGRPGILCAYLDNYNPYRERIVVPASNKALVLALAAMVDDENPHVGECIIALESCVLKNGEMYKISKVNGGSFWLEGVDDSNTAGTTRFDFCRKATKDEIFERFVKKSESFGRVHVSGSKATVIGNNIHVTVEPAIEESIVKTRLETLIKDYPEIQDDLSELFPGLIEKADIRGTVSMDSTIWVDNNHAAWRRGSGEHAGKGLFLCENYNWEIVIDNEGSFVLLPTKK